MFYFFSRGGSSMMSRLFFVHSCGSQVWWLKFVSLYDSFRRGFDVDG